MLKDSRIGETVRNIGGGGGGGGGVLGPGGRNFLKFLRSFHGKNALFVYFPVQFSVRSTFVFLGAQHQIFLEGGFRH